MDFKKIFQGILVFLGFVFVIGFFWWGMQWFSYSLENFFQLKLSQEQDKFLASLAPEQNIIAEKSFPIKIEGMGELESGAESAISVQSDLNPPAGGPGKIIFSKNEDAKVPVASLTKLITAEVVLENFDLTAKIHISKLAEEQDTRGYLKAGESFIAKDLLYDMLIESDNAAAYAFAEAMGYDSFIKIMNLKANEAGMKNTYFSSPTGLGLTNYSSAKDLVAFAEYILKKDSPILKITLIPEFDLLNYNGSFHHRALNLNDLLKDASLKDRIVAGKTGETKDAKQCLFLIIKAPEGRGYLINVVLGAGDRFLEMKKIINWTDSSYQWK